MKKKKIVCTCSEEAPHQSYLLIKGKLHCTTCQQEKIKALGSVGKKIYIG